MVVGDPVLGEVALVGSARDQGEITDLDGDEGLSLASVRVPQADDPRVATLFFPDGVDVAA